MMNLTDLIGLGIGFLLTVLVFSYLIGDNPFFRLAIHIFIGVSAAYVALITVNNVLIPRLVLPLINGPQDERLLSIILLVPSIFLFFKFTPLKNLVSWPVAIMVGIGAAVAIGGAVTGTLFPQLLGTINSIDPSAYTVTTNSWNRAINGIIIIIGTLSSLLYFHFGTRDFQGQGNRQNPLIDTAGKIGKVFIAITFGALYAGVFLSALAALIERLSYIWDFLVLVGFQLFTSQ